MAGKVLLIISVIVFAINGYKLKQVLMLSRHNIRTPLTSNLDEYTSKIWPQWKEKFGHLTAKGAVLEGYMGEYIAEWLKNEGLLSETCPDNDRVFIYANTIQRTLKSAKAFVQSAFPNCTIAVHHADLNKRDPLIIPVVHNTTETFKNVARSEMQRRLDLLNLEDAYVELNRILDLNTSEMCNTDTVCDLSKEKNDILLVFGQQPDLNGPLSIGNKVTDAFLMSYYDGKPLDEIGWGEIRPETWKLLTEITRENQNVRFNNTSLAKDVAKPLLNYISNILMNEAPVFTSIFCHDSNLNSIMAALGFNPFVLPEQNEKTPVGAKLIFQKWYDDETNLELLKINLMYLSTEQLRAGTKLTVENQPKSVVLSLKQCNTDTDGFCPWDDFMKILESLY